MKVGSRLATAILEASLDGIIAFNKKSELIFWSRGAEELTALGSDEVIGQKLASIFPIMEETEEVQMALQGLAPPAKEIFFQIPKNSVSGFCQISFAPLRNKEGKITGGIGILRDITKSRNIQETLTETEERFKTMANSAPVLLWMAGTDGNCNFFNQYWLDFTGKTFEEEWGVGWAEGVYFEDFQKCIDTYVRSFNKRESFEMEYRLMNSKGEYRWILDRGTPRFTAGKKFAGYIGSCIDITDRKRNESELVTAREKALEASRMKSDFLTNMSHEIRTPLFGVIGVTDLLRKTRLTAEQQSLTATLEDSGQSLLSLVNEILDFAKIESGKQEMHPMVFSVYSLVKEIVSLLEPRARSKGLELSLKVELGRLQYFRGDSGKIRQILMNLLGNAIKFTQKGNIRVKVSLVDQDSKSTKRVKVKFEVRDTGVGIPEEDLRKIFEPFVQLDGSLTRAHGGTGLGLAICKQLLDLLGGKISVRSSPNKGSKFWFSVPLKKVEKNPTPSVRTENINKTKASRVPLQPTKASGRVLVAEDNPVNQFIIQKQLESVGYTVDIVENGKKAVDAVMKNQYDIVLMDCQMPEMDGMEATREIRRIRGQKNGLPIIAFTAHAFQGERQKCLDAGMDEYISKPVDFEKLFKLMQGYLKEQN